MFALLCDSTVFRWAGYLSYPGPEGRGALKVKDSYSPRGICLWRNAQKSYKKPPRKPPRTVLLFGSYSSLYLQYCVKNKIWNISKKTSILQNSFVIHLWPLFCHISFSLTCHIRCTSSFCMQRDKRKNIPLEPIDLDTRGYYFCYYFLYPVKEEDTSRLEA
jgi:hypothetical protein